MKMRAETRIFGRNGSEFEVESHRFDARETEAYQMGVAEKRFDQIGQGAPVLVAVGPEMNARDDDLDMAIVDQSPDGGSDSSDGGASGPTSHVGNDAVGAMGITAVLDFHEGPRAIEDGRDGFDRREFGRLEPGDVRVEHQGFGRACVGLQGGLRNDRKAAAECMADDRGNSGQGGEHLGISLGGTAGDHDACIGIFALNPSDGFSDVCVRAMGDGAGVENHDVGVVDRRSACELMSIECFGEACRVGLIHATAERVKDVATRVGHPEESTRIAGGRKGKTHEVAAKRDG